MNFRILAVDPGEKRIGIALSDPTRTLARPLQVIKHVSRAVDAATIAQIARDNDVGLVVIGQALDVNGNMTYQARRACRIKEAISSQINVPIVMWDESLSTVDALNTRSLLKQKSKKRTQIDAIAAAVILQSYLDSNRDQG